MTLQTTSVFLDSGAFSLQRSKTAPDYKEYMDRYARFIRKRADVLDFYANVDVIGNPELSWENQQYLEKEHGLKPVPVVHCGSDLKWLQRYADRNYDLIGFGGLLAGGIASPAELRVKRRMVWLNQAFKLTAGIRVHGFGVTFGPSSFRLLKECPWWSVDNTTWIKEPAYGGIFLPRKRGNQFVFDQAPFIMKVTERLTNSGRLHTTKLAPLEKSILKEWLELIGLQLEGEEGVAENGVSRNKACITYFELMRKAYRSDELNIFYSGAGPKLWPDDRGRSVAVMVTFADKSARKALKEVNCSHEVIV